MAAVLQTISKFVIGLFSLAIIGTMMVFTYGALGKIFTGNLLYIMFGMLLFDIATLAWGIAFIFQSRGILQYAAAAMGFVVGLIGTIGMIGAEVMLEGMTPEQIAASPIPTYMRYGFIAVLAPSFLNHLNDSFSYHIRSLISIRPKCRKRVENKSQRNYK